MSIHAILTLLVLSFQMPDNIYTPAELSTEEEEEEEVTVARHFSSDEDENFDNIPTRTPLGFRVRNDDESSAVRARPQVARKSTTQRPRRSIPTARKSTTQKRRRRKQTARKSTTKRARAHTTRREIAVTSSSSSETSSETSSSSSSSDYSIAGSTDDRLIDSSDYESFVPSIVSRDFIDYMDYESMVAGFDPDGESEVACECFHPRHFCTSDHDDSPEHQCVSPTVQSWCCLCHERRMNHSDTSARRSRYLKRVVELHENPELYERSAARQREDPGPSCICNVRNRKPRRVRRRSLRSRGLRHKGDVAGPARGSKDEGGDDRGRPGGSGGMPMAVVV